MEGHIVAGAPDQNGLKPDERAAPRQAGSQPACQSPYSGATRSSCTRIGRTAGTLPTRAHRSPSGSVASESATLLVLSPAGAEEGGAMPGDADVAAAWPVTVQGAAGHGVWER